MPTDDGCCEAVLRTPVFLRCCGKPPAGFAVRLAGLRTGAHQLADRAEKLLEPGMFGLAAPVGEGGRLDLPERQRRLHVLDENRNEDAARLRLGRLGLNPLLVERMSPTTTRRRSLRSPALVRSARPKSRPARCPDPTTPTSRCSSAPRQASRPPGGPLSNN